MLLRPLIGSLVLFLCLSPCTAAWRRRKPQPPAAPIVRCPAISLAAGSLLCSNVNIARSICTPSCNWGYKPSAASTTCQSSGAWSNSITCGAIPCSSLTGYVANGSVSCSHGNSMGSVCTVTCLPGHAARFGSVRCLLGGTWTATPSCPMASTFDPCLTSQHTVKKNNHWRSSSYSPPTGQLSHCDNSLALKHDWYRFDSRAGNQMPTSCPANGMCGTTSPVYAGVSQPSATAQGIFTAPLYANMQGQGCGQVIGAMRYKNCSNFLVYELHPLMNCASAYCMGTEALCPTGFTSLNDFSPGCTLALQNISITSKVEPAIIAAVAPNGTRVISQVAFNCTLNIGTTGSFDNNTIVEVQWFASKRGKVFQDQVAFQVGFFSVYLRTADWIDWKGDNLGQNMSCRARAVSTTKSNTTQYSTWAVSQEFFAGVKVSPTSLTLVRGQKNGIVQLQLTVPLACSIPTPSGLIPLSSPCQPEVLMYNPKFAKNKQWTQGSCKNVAQTDLVFEETSCGAKFDSRSPFTPINMTIKAKKYPGVAGITTGKIRMGTKGYSFDQLFSYYNLPDIDVTILPSPVATAGKCTLYADPHVISFDGQMFDHQEIGEYILVQDDSFDIQVNGFFQSRGSWTRLCAIAIRSGADIFYFDHCQHNARVYTTSPTIVPYRMGKSGCSVGSMSVTLSTGMFEVHLPSGMRVKGNLHYHLHIHLLIFTSDLNLGQLKGICGFYDGNLINDLTHSDGKTVSGPSGHRYQRQPAFSASWKAQQSLFSGNVQIQTNRSQTTFCSCPFTPTTAQNQARVVDNSAECSASKAMQVCYNNINGKDVTNLLQKKCQACNRNRCKRSSGQLAKSDYDDEFQGVFNPYIDPNYKSQSPVWHNGWSDPKARQVCSRKLAELSSVAALKVATISSADYLEQCIYDIKISGGTEFVQDMQTRLIDDARDEVLRDQSQWVTSSSGEIQPPFQILNQLCPSNCSNNGTCVEGECQCDVDHYGDDCSKSRSAAPVVAAAAGGGVCHEDERPCRTIAIYGQDFPADATDANCSVSWFEIDATGRLLASSQPVQTEMEVETEFKAFCELPKRKRRRRSPHSGLSVQGYFVQLPNHNATVYSLPIPVLVINSTCTLCNSTALTCQLKNDTCYIESQCYNANYNKTQDFCSYCNPSLHQFLWSLRKEDECAKVSDTNDVQLWYILGTAVAACLLCLLAVTVYCVKRSTTRKSAVHSEKYRPDTANTRQQMSPPDDCRSPRRASVTICRPVSRQILVRSINTDN